MSLIPLNEIDFQWNSWIDIKKLKKSMKQWEPTSLGSEHCLKHDTYFLRIDAPCWQCLHDAKLKKE